MKDRGITSKKRVERIAGGLAVAVVATSVGCATGRVSNVDAYDDVPMNRVVPYPSQEELRKRAFELVIVDRPAVGIEEGLLDRPRAQVRRALEGVAADAGATVIDRSLSELGALRTEGVLGELEGRETEEVTGADYALATRFSKYQYAASWKKPFKLPWQSDEEVASKPGTCEHTAAVELDIQMIEVGSNDTVARTFALEHQAQQETKDLDPACALPPVTLSVLFEKALDEALSCLDLPLGAALAPRGHLTGHRKAPGADRHIYRITLGSGQGIEPGDGIEVRREQRSMSPTGAETREERVIATGEVTDQVRPQQSWVAIDPSKASDSILDGDLVRPVFSEGLLSRMTGPDCDEILTER
ncbi:MAG: hypothetical protein NXI30_23050 [bacterium]|nr:hypothetical protein [bacterium]